MPHLIWSPAALTDVQRVCRFLAQKNDTAAQRALKIIRAGVKILAHQPEAGRPIDDMDPTVREWLIGFGGSGYIALYGFDGETATILTVRQQKEAGY
jgi:plasmid stabilization system protein ParE